MSQEDRKSYSLEIVRFGIYLVTLIVSIMLAYSSFDKRVTVLETEMPHKVSDQKLFDKLDQLKDDISRKIETEVQKVRKKE